MPNFRIVLPALLASVWLNAASAQQIVDAVTQAAPAQSLWEFGLAGAVGYVPDYPAASRYQVQALPLPYFIYRGRFFRSDQGGVRVEALRQPRFELDLSVGASLASNSGSKGARAGLPDLDYLLEAGPNLRVILARPDASTRFSLELPVRSVVSTNFRRFNDRGFLFAPRLDYLQRSHGPQSWRIHAAIGPDFATEKLQDYFYQVDPQYARPGRPAFNAQGGYLGTNLEVSLVRPVTPRVKIFAATKLSYFGAARNENSPLFQDDFNYSLIVGFAWSIWQSKETVARAE